MNNPTRAEALAILNDQSASEQLRRFAAGWLELADAEKVWRCFHCGFETYNHREAAGHFGDIEEESPLCVAWADLNADGRASEYQNTHGQLLEEFEENCKLRQKIEGLEYRIEGQLSEIHSFKPFRQCDSIQQIFNIYDSMEGRAFAAEERLQAIDALEPHE